MLKIPFETNTLFERIKASQLVLIMLAALSLGTVFHQDAVLQQFFSPDDRVAAPIQSSRIRLGDHYYYYILSRKALTKLNPFTDNKQRQPFFYENSGLENIYPGALLVAGVLDGFARLIPVNWSMQVVLSLILQVSFLLTSVLIFYCILRESRVVPWIELFVFAFAWAYFSRGLIYGVYSGSPTYMLTASGFYYPDFLRLVNPQMAWSFAFLYLSALVIFFLDKSREKYILVIVLSLLFGLFALVLTATIILGLGMYGLARLVKERRIDYHLLGIGVALLLSFLLVRYQMHLFHQSEKGASLQTGNFIGLDLRFHYFSLLILLPLIRRYLPSAAKSPLSWIYFASLTMGFFGDSFFLGGRIWLRGSGILAHFLIIYAILEFLRSSMAKYWQRISEYVMAPAAAFLSIAVFVFYALGTNFSGWYGYIEKEKGEVIEWLRRHSDRDDVVVSANLEDAYLIPVYTNSQPYVQLFDYSVVGFEQLVQRYFRALDISNDKQEYLQKILAFENSQRDEMIAQVRARPAQRVSYEDYQLHAFYSGVMYYPYNKRVKSIFDTPQQKKEFDQKITMLANDANATDIGPRNYLIIGKKNILKRPEGYRIRFQNDLYEILSVGDQGWNAGDI